MNNLVKFAVFFLLMGGFFTSNAMEQPNVLYRQPVVVVLRHPTPVKDCVRKQTEIYLAPIHIQKLSRDQYLQNPNCLKLINFFKISKYLDTILQNTDVHALDDYVFGSQKQITILLEAGRLYDDAIYHTKQPSRLSLLHVGQAMTQFVNREKPYFEKVFQYEGQSLSIDRITKILENHFSNMDPEVENICPEAREVWSRSLMLALALFQKDHDLTPMQIIFSNAVEGHLTRGGCIQGRINRGFVAYAALLANTGVNLYRR